MLASHESRSRHPAKMMILDNASVLQPLLPDLWRETRRRQQMPEVYRPNGAVYHAHRDTVLRERTLWGKKTIPYIMPPERSVNIDSILDLWLAEAILEKRGKSDGDYPKV